MQLVFCDAYGPFDFTLRLHRDTHTMSSSQFVEFILGYYTNKKIIRRKTAAFLRLCQEDAERVESGDDAHKLD